MIISKKRFEEELSKRMQEEYFKSRIEEKLLSLEDDVRNLKFKMACIEDENCAKVETQCGRNSA